MDKSKIQIIRAKQTIDYIYDGFIEDGFDIFTPYYGNHLFTRILREIWFRCNLPYKQMWYNKKACRIKPNKKVILLKDPLLEVDYLRWLRNKNPNLAIVLEYENRARTTIDPNKAREYITELVSYDKDDCNEYNMTFKEFSFRKMPKKNNQQKEYDILFVGRDKGRYEVLNTIKKRLEKQSIKVELYICANRAFQRFNKPYYRKFLTYEEYLNMAKRSKAILNIMPEGQTSITQRDIEVLLYNFKEITNNKGIKDFVFYNPSRYYVIEEGNDNDEEIKKFLDSPFEEIPLEELKEYCNEAVYSKFLNKYM